MIGQRHVAGGGDGLTGAVIRRRADATETEHGFVSIQRAAVVEDEGIAVVAEVVHSMQAQAARVAGGEGIGKVDVAAAAAEDFVTDDKDLQAFRLHDGIPDEREGKVARRV